MSEENVVHFFCPECEFQLLNESNMPGFWWCPKCGYNFPEKKVRKIAAPNCPRCGRKLSRWIIETPDPRGRIAYRCIPCWDEGHCIEGVGRLDGKALADVRDVYEPPAKEPPAPDWDKIKKLVQIMTELIDKIEKEIEPEESRPFQNCFEDCPLGPGE